MQEYLTTAELVYAPTRHIDASKLAENLFSVDTEEIERFKQSVLAAKGRAILFVHPYFERYRNEIESRPAEHARSLSERIDAFIKNARIGTPAVIIMEERDRIPSTLSHLKTLSPKIPIVLIPTKTNGGVPSLDFVVKETPLGYWEIVANGLKGVEIKNLLIGGMYFSRFHTKCVNVVLRGLTPLMSHIEVSSLTQPLARHDAHKPI